jgi:hypothetical protein
MTALAQSVPSQRLLTMTVEEREPNTLVRVVVRGLMKPEEGAAALFKLYQEHPRAPYYDRLFDLIGYETGLDAKHVAQVAAAYRERNTDPSFPCRTAIVTRDPHFQLWARGMDFQFEGRRHRAFSTVEEAERWLAVPLEERKAAD